MYESEAELDVVADAKTAEEYHQEWLSRPLFCADCLGELPRECDNCHKFDYLSCNWSEEHDDPYCQNHCPDWGLFTGDDPENYGHKCPPREPRSVQFEHYEAVVCSKNLLGLLSHQIVRSEDLPLSVAEEALIRVKRQQSDREPRHQRSPFWAHEDDRMHALIQQLFTPKGHRLCDCNLCREALASKRYEDVD